MKIKLKIKYLINSAKLTYIYLPNIIYYFLTNPKLIALNYLKKIKQLHKIKQNSTPAVNYWNILKIIARKIKDRQGEDIMYR